MQFEQPYKIDLICLMSTFFSLPYRSYAIYIKMFLGAIVRGYGAYEHFVCIGFTCYKKGRRKNGRGKKI